MIVNKMGLQKSMQLDECSAAHPVYYNRGKGVFPCGVNQQICEADHSLSSSAVVKKSGAKLTLPPQVFIACCLTDAVESN
jgi:hypothetical protein